MCNSKLYHIHVNKLVQNVFFDFVKINALHMLIQVCLKFKMVYAYFTRLCHFMPTSDFIAILKSEISKFCIPILAIQKKKISAWCIKGIPHLWEKFCTQALTFIHVYS